MSEEEFYLSEVGTEYQISPNCTLVRVWHGVIIKTNSNDRSGVSTNYVKDKKFFAPALRFRHE